MFPLKNIYIYEEERKKKKKNNKRMISVVLVLKFTNERK